MRDKANILVVGTSGAGKSTLINTVLGKNVAKVGSGKHVTEKPEAYENDELNFRLIDSRGFEYSMLNTRRSVKDIRSWMKSGIKSADRRVHMIWFCVDATSERFSKQTIMTLEAVKKEWKDVPIIVVLTKSFFRAEDENHIQMVRDQFLRHEERTGMPIAILPVLSIAPEGENIPARGIDDLLEITNNHLDEAIAATEKAVKAYLLRFKRIQAQAITISTTLAAAAVGITPVKIPDSSILVPMETAMITGIAWVYDLDQDDTIVRNLLTRLIESGTTTVTVKTILEKLKSIPGLANAAVSTVNAVVAGIVVFTMGETANVLMEKIYTGTLDPEDVNRVGQCVESKFSSFIKDLGETLTETDETVDTEGILHLLVQQEVA